jgi:hypothetical protein
MKFLPTSCGPMTAAQVINELNYSCYAFNRARGMSAESLGQMFTTTGAAMEARYARECQEKHIQREVA